MNAENKIRTLLEEANIEIGGSNPWDPQVKKDEFYNMVIAKGSLGLGEAYMHGLWECDDLTEFFSRITSVNFADKIPFNLNTALLFVQATIRNRQSKVQTMKMGELHYDIPFEVWEATLDTTLTGSCAYYKTGNETLDEAQEIKKKMSLDKLAIEPGNTLLDIGVGWASFSSYAYENYGAKPIGITVSKGQRDYIKQKYGDVIDVRVHDYRDLKLGEPVDRIISVEMFEHVGSDNYRTFFELCRRNIKDNGLMLLHTIVGHRPLKHIDPWMDKYIYPGGCIPTPGQVCTAVHGLFHVEDVHDIGKHYDKTLNEWIDKFEKNWDSVKSLGKKKLGMDPEVFCRMWKYHYLASAGGFRSRIISVHQYVLSPKGIPGGFKLYDNTR